MKCVCIVDDETAICESLQQIMTDEGFAAEVFYTLEDFEKRMTPPSPPIDLILLDIRFKDDDGISFLQRHPQLTSRAPVVIMSGHGTIETAVRATKLGAYDFIEKPISYDRLMVIIDRALKHYEILREREHLRTEVARELGLIGADPNFTRAINLAIKAAASGASVLIEGEHGTGKELFSRLIHRLSQRNKEPFVTFNCAAVPETLVESELFGYERGAFTGAVSRHIGKFELAQRGTLFLDEIGDMPMNMQAKLLRVLQDKTISRLGGTEEIPLDIRFMCATNKNMAQLIQKGLFRQDLFYRVNVIPIKVPRLSNRRSDIPMLLNYFSQILSRHIHVPPKVFSEEAMKYLSNYQWPGNVRQLRNFIERVLVFSDSDLIQADMARHLLTEASCVDESSPKSAGTSTAFHTNPSAPPGEAFNYRRARDLFEKHYFETKLAKHRGNVTKVASEVGLERSHLHRKLKKLGVQYDSQA